MTKMWSFLPALRLYGWMLLCLLCSTQISVNAVISTLPEDVVAYPAVHKYETVKTYPPIISAFPRLETLNRTVIMRPKSPNLPAVFHPPSLIAFLPTFPGQRNDTGNQTKTKTDNAHVRISRLPGLSDLTVPPRFDHLPPFESDPANFSGRIHGQKEMIFRLTDKKPVSLSKINKLSDVIRGIYWMLDSPSVRIVHKSDANKRRFTDAEKWIKDVKTKRKVVKLESNGLYCGHHYLVTFDDGTLACTKQRSNYDQIQGEIFAYFLADLLDMRHYFPPTVLTKAGPSRLFATVMDAVHNSSTWDPAKPLIITKFLTHLKPIFLPKILHSLLKFIVNQTSYPTSEPQNQNSTTVNTTTAKQASTDNEHNQAGLEQGHTVDGTTGKEPVSGDIVPNHSASVDRSPFVLPVISTRSSELANCTDKELRELEQWSDLVMFDYLVGNLDRISNLAVNLHWHQQMLSLPVHNIYQSAEDGQFIFMDNESGLFHGYRLLHQYDKYLQPLLRSFCIFNKSTVQAVKKLHQSRNAGATLMKMLEADYPRLINRLPGIGPKTSQILQKRLRYAYKHIRFCEDNYYLP
ncbi:four-jointed box protein 1-like isoform X2 [Paramacrobiotus metropolitanus]|nr:four-jointed box protein 1-like isoform X2 [Paramacrobiotus metropolitanus]XP_055353376.1 four-jointed box protein 1-like isoform X2 [Paramacrobiotus metropolitanus]